MKKTDLVQINEHISDALSQWSEIMITADADNWSVHLDYSDKDLLNSLQIFLHVASNVAIKNRKLDNKNVTEKIKVFTDALEECFGINSIELTKRVLNK
jgi:hypothetical protein